MYHVIMDIKHYWDNFQIEGYTLVCYQKRTLDFWGGDAVRVVYVDKDGHWYRDTFFDNKNKITRIAYNSFLPFDTSELNYPGWIYADSGKKSISRSIIPFRKPS